MMSQDPGMNPYAGGDFSAGATPTPQETSVPQWIGILNIVFASLLLLCLAGYCLQILMQGVLGSDWGQNQQAMQERIEQDRERKIEVLIEAEKEAATEDDEAASQLRAEIESLKQQPVPKIPDVQNLIGMKDPAVLGAYIFDAGTGVILNVLMLASGIGLISRRAWGRKLGIWVAGFKVIRLVIVALMIVLVISPVLSESMAKLATEMGQMNQQGPQPSEDQFHLVYTIMFAVWAVALLVLGSIYPLVCLRLLTRRHVILACKETEQETFRPEVF